MVMLKTDVFVRENEDCKVVELVERIGVFIGTHKSVFGEG